jgi:hypothetical protein
MIFLLASAISHRVPHTLLYILHAVVFDCLLNEASTERVDVDSNNQPAASIEKAERRTHLLPQEEEAAI